MSRLIFGSSRLPSTPFLLEEKIHVHAAKMSSVTTPHLGSILERKPMILSLTKTPVRWLVASSVITEEGEAAQGVLVEVDDSGAVEVLQAEEKIGVWAEREIISRLRERWALR